MELSEYLGEERQFNTTILAFLFASLHHRGALDMHEAAAALRLMADKQAGPVGDRIRDFANIVSGALRDGVSAPTISLVRSDDEKPAG